MSDATTRLWLHGLLELCLLGLLDDQRDYGLGLTNRLSEAGLGFVPGGTIYPALARLEATGLVSSAREPSSSGPPRKYFELTQAGREALEGRRTEWRQFSRSIHVVLGTRELT
jgi:PadR family transcriptional regulator PadR